MWETESEHIQPREYLYPPQGEWLGDEARQAPATKPRPQPEKAAVRPQPPRAREEGGAAASGSRQRAPEKPTRGREESNWLLFAQLAVCLAMVGFVLLMKQTDPAFYREMGQSYRAAIEQGVELSGEGELLKFTEEAAARLRQAALEVMGQAEEGAGGLNPASDDTAPPAGYSLDGYALREAPALPLETFGVTSAYGWRKHPISGELDFHGGVDMAAAAGSKIGAVLPGVVLQAGWSDSYGNYARILHEGGLVSSYNHMSECAVLPGQRMQRGQTVGLVGSTGVSTGPHLHLEFLLNGVRVDPAAALELG